VAHRHGDIGLPDNVSHILGCLVVSQQTQHADVRKMDGFSRFLSYVASSHSALKSDLGNLSFHFSITSGFPPWIT
jgi:hypothetical protein